MPTLPTVEGTLPDGRRLTINAADRDAWEAKGWKPAHAPPAPPPADKPEPKHRGKAKPEA